MRPKHENVMLLVMSTLPYQPKINSYQADYGGKALYFKSLSQMEPHTKYVLHMLAEKGEKLDRIVILESAKARTERPVNWNHETATTLFTKRIYNYLGANETVDIHLADELEELKESPCDLRLYEHSFPEIITIDLDNPVFFWEAVKAIRHTEAKGSVYLYMDMQGGDRNAVSQMNAIAELLVRQQVSIRGRYANDFEPKRNPPLHTIRDAGKEYRTYQLISAMDIFARYGWGDQLVEYFKDSGEGDTKEDRLSEAVQEASLAISRCNGEGFDSAVRKIEKLAEEFKNPETVTEMDVVYQDIYENYETLFGAKYRYVAQIRWCLDRHFLQQALTIFEAKMPGEFVRSGLIYYLTEDGDQSKFLKTCETLYNRLDPWNYYRMKDLNHYLIKDYCRINKKSEICDPEQLLKFGVTDKRKVISLLKRYKDICGLRNKMNHASSEEHNPDGFFSYMSHRYKDSVWKEYKETDYEAKIRSFLSEWEKMAGKVPETLQKKIIDLS